MGENSGVSWCDASNGPWRGCRKVSRGCANCYAAASAKRFGWDFSIVRRTKDKTFYAALDWEPCVIFVCPESDFFIEEADEWRPDYWDKVIGARPDHIFILLTKRPENITPARLPWDWTAVTPWDHVYLGVSVEDQRSADERIPLLLETPAAHRWVSAEPLLAAVDLSKGLPIYREAETVVDRYIGPTETLADRRPGRGWQRHDGIGPFLDAVVVGAESGPGRRPCDPAWVRSIADQCRAASIPCYVKQGTDRWPGRQGNLPDDLWMIKETPWR